MLPYSEPILNKKLVKDIVMKKSKDSRNKRADKFVDDIKSGGKPGDNSAAQVEVKPEIVKDIPSDTGRHGVDAEKDLNPEE